jgi:hypothetical protein
MHRAIVHPPVHFNRKNQEERTRTRIIANIDELMENIENTINSDSDVVTFHFRLTFDDHTDWCNNQAHNLAQLSAINTRFKDHVQPIVEAIRHSLELINSNDVDTLRLVAHRLRQVVHYSRTINGITKVIRSHKVIANPQHRELAIDALRQTANIVGII